MAKSIDDILLFGASGFVGISIITSSEKNNLNWKGISRALNSGNIEKVALTDTSKLKTLINNYPIINAMVVSKPKFFELNTKDVLNNFINRLNLFQSLIVNSNVKKVIKIYKK